MHGAGLKLGAFPACPEEEAKELLSRSKFILLVFPMLPSMPLHLLVIGTEFLLFQSWHSILTWLFPPSLSGVLWSLQQAEYLKWEEAMEVGSREHMGWRQRGGGKMREAVVQDLRQKALYGLLKGVASYPHLLPHLNLPLPWSLHLSPSCHHSPSQPLQESTGPEVSDPAGQATVSASSSCHSSTQRWNIPAHMQTLRVQVGECQVHIPVLGWGLQRGPINLTGHLLVHPCKEGSPGGGVGVPSLQQDVLQSGHVLRHHRKTHK